MNVHVHSEDLLDVLQYRAYSRDLEAIVVEKRRPVRVIKVDGL
jgi:phage tail protein X